MNKNDDQIKQKRSNSNSKSKSKNQIVSDASQTKQTYTESDKSAQDDSDQPVDKFKLDTDDYDFLRNSFKRIIRKEESIKKQQKVKKLVDSQIDSSDCQPI